MAKRQLFLFAAFVLALTFVGSALAQRAPTAASGGAPPGGIPPGGGEDGPPAEHQHGTMQGHLPPTQANVDLVAKLKVSGAVDDSVTDVAVLRDTAYLGQWDVPDCPGGFWAVDISNPSAPRELTFVSAPPGTYQTEGMHAMRLTTPAFTGDILIVSNERCARAGVGGVSIYDVSNPANPVPLSIGRGDTERTAPRAHSSHSAYGWDAGDRAFVALVDNEEIDDIDIMEITDPRNPVYLTETGILDWPDAQTNLAHGEDPGVHDMVVRKVAGNWLMLASYWDAGYVVVNMNDPANPQFVKDSDYPAVDPLTGVPEPEGNAHEAEWSGCPEEGVPNLTATCNVNPKYIVGADEDFSPFRAELRIATGPNAGLYGAGEFGWTVPIAQKYPDNQVNGPTIFAGSGCRDDPDTPEIEGDVNENGIPDSEEVPPATVLSANAGEEKIAVFTRGVCFFSEKVRSAEEAGYDVAVIGNHHIGALGGIAPNSFVCGGQGSPVLGIASGVCTGHRAMHLMFNDTPEYQPTSGSDPAVFYGDLPAIGTQGERIVVKAGVFDSWGYLDLIDADTMEVVDAYAVPEALDPRFAFGFGDLSVHEVATDATFPLGYVSWYSAGARVVEFSRGDLREVGRFIDEGGNDMWGVEFHMRRSGTGFKRFFLESDRDYGLYIFRYGTDVRIAKRAPRLTRVGRTFTYTLTVRNPGTISETRTILRDRLPRGVRFLGASTTQGRCRLGANRTVVCNLGRLAEDARAQVRIRVRATRAGIARNVTTVGGQRVDYDTGNNRAVAVTRVARAPVAPRPRLTGSR